MAIAAQAVVRGLSAGPAPSEDAYYVEFGTDHFAAFKRATRLLRRLGLKAAAAVERLPSPAMRLTYGGRGSSL